jgi:hypothetical protein
MAPNEPAEVIAVQEEHNGITTLKCGDRFYQYSRYGLEVKE